MGGPVGGLEPPGVVFVFVFVIAVTRVVASALLAAALVSGLSLASGCARRDPAAEHAALVARGAEIFQARCSLCHGPKGDWPITERLKGRKAEEFYALFDHLPSVNPIMPPFDDAPDADHRAVAAYLASLGPARGGYRQHLPDASANGASPRQSQP